MVRVERPGGVEWVAALQGVGVRGVLGVGELVVLVEDEDDGHDEDDDDADQDHHRHQHVVALAPVAGADGDDAGGGAAVLALARHVAEHHELVLGLHHPHPLLPLPPRRAAGSLAHRGFAHCSLYQLRLYSRVTRGSVCNALPVFGISILDNDIFDHFDVVFNVFYF